MSALSYEADASPYQERLMCALRSLREALQIIDSLGKPALGAKLNDVIESLEEESSKR